MLRQHTEFPVPDLFALPPLQGVLVGWDARLTEVLLQLIAIGLGVGGAVILDVSSAVVLGRLGGVPLSGTGHHWCSTVLAGCHEVRPISLGCPHEWLAP